MPTDERALRDLLEKTQAYVRELDACEAELIDGRALREATEDALAIAEQKLIPHPGEQRENVRLQALALQHMQKEQLRELERLRARDAELELTKK